MSFRRLEFIPPLVEWAETIGYPTPTPIQIKAIPQVLVGRDIVGCAQTRTGKTTAFILPILQRITSGKAIKALVITPTRELAEFEYENQFLPSQNQTAKVAAKVAYDGGARRGMRRKTRRR